MESVSNCESYVKLCYSTTLGLHVPIEDSDLSIGHTSAKPRLDVRLVPAIEEMC
jgi:hypothetical protein